MDEEPMELSGDGGRNDSWLHVNQNNSLSDMDVDTSHDRSFSKFGGTSFSFQAMNATLATSSPFLYETKSVGQESIATPIRMRPLTKKSKDIADENKVQKEKIDSILKEASDLIERKDKKRRSGQSKKRELSPREKRINQRKSKKDDKSLHTKLLGWIFLAVLIALLSTFLLITQKCHIDMDVNKFEFVFDQNVFGQHIAKYALISTLKNISKRMQNDTKLSTNPLVFSFHGWTGVGKNFVTQQLLYGFDNARVTTFFVPLHFPHRHEDYQYKQNIQQWVKGNITLCHVNLFVFDEMDKATQGLLEGLLSVMKSIKGIAMEKTWIIFLFLSNSRGHQINKYLFTQMNAGKIRKEITFEEILPILTEIDTEDEWYKEFLSEGLINTFVPFLPLNKHHVHQCIEKDILKRGKRPTAKLIDIISNEMHYIQPIKDGEEFSLTGCKRVSDKVDIHL